MNRDKHLFLGETFRIGLPVVSGILLARYLPTSTYVDFFVLVSLSSIGVSLATFGLNLSIFFNKSESDFYRIANLSVLFNCLLVSPFLMVSYLFLNPHEVKTQFLIVLILEVLFNGYYQFSNKLRSVFTSQKNSIQFLVFASIRFCCLFLYLQNQNLTTLICYFVVVFFGLVLSLKGAGFLNLSEYRTFLLNMIKGYSLGLTSLLTTIFDAFVVYLISTNVNSSIGANLIFLVKIAAVMMIFTHSQAFTQLTLENLDKKTIELNVSKSSTYIFFLGVPVIALLEHSFDFFPNFEISQNGTVFLLVLCLLRSTIILIGNRLTILGFSRSRNVSLTCGVSFLGVSIFISKIVTFSLQPMFLGVLVLIAESIVLLASFTFLRSIRKKL